MFSTHYLYILSIQLIDCIYLNIKSFKIFHFNYNNATANFSLFILISDNELIQLLHRMCDDLEFYDIGVEKNRSCVVVCGNKIDYICQDFCTGNSL